MLSPTYVRILQFPRNALYYPHRLTPPKESDIPTVDVRVHSLCENPDTRATQNTQPGHKNRMRILNKLLLLAASILAVSLVLGLADFWRPTIRGIGLCQTIQWLIDEGYSPEEIAKHPEIARLTRGEIRFPTDAVPADPDDWTKSDARFTSSVFAVLDRKIEEFKKSYAEGVAESIEWELRNAPFVKRLAVNEVIIAALETRLEGEEPFTIENSLPASTRMEVEAAFGSDADALLLEIERAYSTDDARARVLESHGGPEEFVNYLVDVRFAPSAE